MRKSLLLFPLLTTLLAFNIFEKTHQCDADFFEDGVDVQSIIEAAKKIDASKFPIDYFAKPVKATIRLSGTFGELRPNHFHSGIDIKPAKGGAGQPLYAAADGYVERIKVSPSGYGNALYFKHPNGYKTVYAHLQSFDKKIADYVKKAQYNKQSFSVNLYPEAGRFSFKKGEQIGKMGNSGGSTGPHLHFEIRNAGDVPCNPLLFGIPFEDTRKPKMHQLKVYHLNKNKETIDTKTINLSKTEGEYNVKGDTITIGAWRIGMGLKVYDHHNGVSNWNGIYALKMYKNDSLAYEFNMNKFSFGETRYINAHLDYEEQVSKKSYFNRCFELAGNRLSIYGKDLNDGVVKLFKNQPTKIEFVASDANGNESRLKFWVKRGEITDSKANTFNYILKHNEANVINTGSVIAEFGSKTFYENCYLNYTLSTDNSKEYYSSVHHLGEYTTPVHKYFDLSIAPFTTIPKELKSKAFIAFCDKNNNIKNCGGKWEGNMLHAKVRTLGNFSIMIDNEAPIITPISFKNDMRGRSKMSFKIQDNVSTTGKARSLRYTGKVDGKWVLFELDGKKNLITHYFDERISKGEHTLNLEVKDDRGNVTVYERAFIR